jgi:hypothetical protein
MACRHYSSQNHSSCWSPIFAGSSVVGWLPLSRLKMNAANPEDAQTVAAPPHWINDASGESSGNPATCV